MQKSKLFFWINTLILFLFSVIFILNKNYEFLLYIGTLFLGVYFLYVLDKKYNFSSLSLSLFSVWMFLHFCGGSVYLEGVRLYDTILIPLFGDPLFILKYDQVVHTFCYFVLTLLIYQVLKNYIKNARKKENNKKFILGVFTFLGGIAIGSLNEIIEFSTVVLFGSTGVGGYYNNSLDLIFNSIGALLAVLFSSKN
jgi:putative membrane protein